MQKATHFSWLERFALKKLSSRGVDTLIPPPTVAGRPDLSRAIKAYVTDHDVTRQGGQRKIGVVCSGPDGMGRAVRNTCAVLQSKGSDVSVCIEKFGW